MAGIDEPILHYITKGGELHEIQSPKYKLVSSHTARRSSATNMKLSGMPDNLIQACTGYKTLMQLLKDIKQSYKLDQVVKLKQYDYFADDSKHTDLDEILDYVRNAVLNGSEEEWMLMLKKKYKSE